MNVQSVKSPVAESDQKVPAAANPIDVLLAIHRRNIEALLKRVFRRNDESYITGRRH
jgi:hypothetical protein